MLLISRLLDQFHTYFKLKFSIILNSWNLKVEQGNLLSLLRWIVIKLEWKSKLVLSFELFQQIARFSSNKQLDNQIESLKSVSIFIDDKIEIYSRLSSDMGSSRSRSNGNIDFNLFENAQNRSNERFYLNTNRSHDKDCINNRGLNPSRLQGAQ